MEDLSDGIVIWPHKESSHITVRWPKPAQKSSISSAKKMWTVEPSKGSTLESRYKQQSNLKENNFPKMASFFKA